jgi:hypothetical protein
MPVLQSELIEKFIHTTIPCKRNAKNYQTLSPRSSGMKQNSISRIISKKTREDSRLMSQMRTDGNRTSYIKSVDKSSVK